MMLKQLVERFTAGSMAGLDLGSSALKVAEVDRTSGRVILRRCAVISLDGADPVNPLKRLFDKAGIETTRVALGLAAPELVVRPFQFPFMPKKELIGAIRLEAELAILNGHSLSEMVIDWHTFTSPSKDSIRGLLAVVPKTVLANRLKTARAAGLRPSVVDVEGLALWNAYWVLLGAKESSPMTVLLINVGARTTNLVIAKGPAELLLVRDFPLGAQALAKEQEGDWVAEVQDSLGYARSKSGLRALDAIYVTGGGAPRALLPLLQSTVSAPVTFWNPLSQLGRGTACLSIEESVGPLLAVAIGLALRQPS